MDSLNIPGTELPYAGLEQGAFAMFEQMLAATGGLSLSQVCSITGLEGSTVQNWVKRGWVARPIEKKYHQRQLARILLINALRDSIQLDRIARLLSYMNGLVEDSSDDIINEAQLYDYLCQTLQRIDISKGVSKPQITAVIHSLLDGYVGPHEDSKSRLTAGLCVMALACISGRLRRETELLCSEIID